MNTAKISFWIPLALTIMLSNHALAAPVAQITAPQDGRVFNTITISGTARDTEGRFREYTLAYGEGTQPSAWIPIYTGHTQVIDGVLARWITEQTRRNGIYTLKLTVTDTLGGTAIATVSLDIQNPRISDLQVEITGNFEPQKGEMAAIKFNLEADGYAQLRIRESGGNLTCRRVLHPVGARCGSEERQQFAAGPHEYYWDGLDESGNIMDRTNYRAYFGIIQGVSDPLPPNLPRITGLKVSNALIDPSEEEKVTFTYQLSAAAQVTVHMVDYANPPNLVRILLENQPQSAGINQVVWDGKNNRGLYLATGPYQVEIQAINDTGASLPVFAPCRIYY